MSDDILAYLATMGCVTIILCLSLVVGNWMTIVWGVLVFSGLLFVALAGMIPSEPPKLP